MVRGVAGERLLYEPSSDEARTRRQMSGDDMKILVTGATGNVGSLVVTELLKRGAEVRALVRKQPEAGKLPAGVEVAIGDLLDPVSVERAMQGADKLFLLNAVVTDELTQALSKKSLSAPCIALSTET